LKKTIIPSKTTNAIKKSTMPAITDDSGNIIRGKYIFVIIWLLATNDLLASRRAFENNVQGSNAVKEKMGYGTPSEGTFARLPKKMLKTTIVRNGCRIAQLAPNNVCL
jgi:hypothetical protein